MKGAMSSQPTVFKDTMPGGSESEGPSIATIGGVSYIFVDHTGGDPDAILALRYTGTYQVAWEWSFANTQTKGTACAVWDIDNDGTVELLHSNIYTSTDVGAVWCRVATTGDRHWPGWYGPHDSLNPSSPTLYDVDNDGRTEILFSDDRLDSIYCLNPVNGAKIWSSPAKNASTTSFAPAVGQVIPGGDPELISASGDTVIMLNARTGTRIAAKYLGSVVINSAPAIADVDKDGTMEVFIYTDAPDSLWCLKPSGASFNILWANTIPSGSNNNKQGMGIADLNDDGWLDVVIGSGGSSSSYPTLYDRVHCFRGYDGQVIWRSPVLQGDVHRGVAIADIDGDNRWEVIAQTIPGWVYCIAGESGFIQWSVDANAGDMHDVTVGDTDNDGCVEITAAGDTKGLWIIDAPGTDCGVVNVSEQEDYQRSLRLWLSGKTMHILSHYSGDAALRIYDPTGRLVLARDIRLSEGENSLELELRGGVYVATISLGKETARFTFIAGGVR
jgi:outer membrane protein assembly factor BamB